MIFPTIFGPYSRALASSYGQIAVSLVVQVLLVPLYLRHLGAEGFGILSVLLAVVNFAGFGLVWLSGSMQRAMGEAYATGNHASFRLVRGVAGTVYLAYGALAALMGIGLVYALASLGQLTLPEGQVADIWGAVALTGLYFILLSVLNVDRAALSAQGRQASANLLTVLSQLIYAVAAIPAMLLGGGLTSLMVCFVTGAVAALAVSHRLRRREGAVEPCGETARQVFGRLAGRTGGAFLVYGTLAYFLQADILILGWLAGAETVAAFILVWRLAEWIAVALARIPETMMPYLIHADARGDHAQMAVMYRRLLWASGGLSACAGLGYALLGPWLVRLWVGPDFAPAEPWAYALAGAGIFWLGLARVPMVFGYSMVRLRWISVTMAGELIARVALTILLLPVLGYAAPMAALSLAHGLGAAWSYGVAGWRMAGKGGRVCVSVTG